MRETFEAALRSNWDDLATHRAFAIWLTAQGDPRGELARCQMLIENASNLPAQQCQELQAREQELLAQHQQTWLGDLIPKPPPSHWSPDMACRVEFTWQRGWIVGLRCHKLEIAHARKIAASPELRFLRELDIVTDGWCGSLQKKDRLPNFPFGQFANPKHSHPYCVYPLALSTHLGNLRKFTIGQPVHLAVPHSSDPPENTCFADALLAFVSQLPKLEDLSIAQIHYFGELIDHFALAGPLPALRGLHLYYIPSSDISKLLHCPSLNGVRRLTLHASQGAYATQESRTFYELAAGLTAPLPSLEALKVYREAQGDLLLADLVASPLFDRLRELSIVGSRVTDAGAERLLGARSRATLTALDLSFNIFSPAVLQRLRDAFPFLVATSIQSPEEHQRQREEAAAELQRMMAEEEWE